MSQFINVCLKAENLFDFVEHIMPRFVEVFPVSHFSDDPMQLRPYVATLKRAPCLVYNVEASQGFRMRGNFRATNGLFTLSIIPSDQAYLPYTPFCDYLWVEIIVTLEKGCCNIHNSLHKFTLFDMLEQMNLVCGTMGSENLFLWNSIGYYDPRLLGSSVVVSSLLELFDLGWDTDDPTPERLEFQQLYDRLLARIESESQRCKGPTRNPLISEFYTHYTQIWHRFFDADIICDLEYTPTRLLIGKKLATAIMPHFDLIEALSHPNFECEQVAENMFYVNVFSLDGVKWAKKEYPETAHLYAALLEALQKADPNLVFDNYFELKTNEQLSLMRNAEHKFEFPENLKD